MKTFNKKALALLVTAAMIGSFAGCGKDTSAEESLQAELDELRAQLEAQETAESQATDDEDTEESEETEAVEETVEETEATEPETVYPFPVNKTRLNLTVGEIAEYEDFCVGLAGVRMFDEYESILEGSWYDDDIPVVPDGQVAVTPIFQIYNASGMPLEYDDQLISLYADNVQVTRVDTTYTDSYWVDGLQEYLYTTIDAGEDSAVVAAFNVDENWSTLTIFYGDISWTLTREEILSEPYVYTSMFNQEAPELIEPGTVVYRNTEFELVYDGATTYSEGLRRPYLLFNFTVNNLTSSMLEIEVPNNFRAYYEHRLMDYSSALLDEPINGYNNIHQGSYYGNDVIEIHPGMSSQVFVSFPMYETEGTFTCYFETVNEGVVAVVSSAL